MPTTVTTYFELEVSLQNIQPRIWRRFLLRRNCDFHELHDTIQKACGWWDYHLYLFHPVDDQRLLAVTPYWQVETNDEEIPPVAATVKIADFFWREGDKCLYIYDFGDDWHHLIELKGIVKLKGSHRRRLVGGERAFPHEDSGGIDGYYRCLEALRITEAELARLDEDIREDLLSTRQWLGDWDPERFDYEATARELARRVRY